MYNVQFQTGLFSAAVAALLAVSVPNLQRDPQDTSNFYLAHLYQAEYQQLNGSQPPIPSSLSNPIDPFTPPSSSVWVNGLWFLSLVISLTCALLSTLLLRWARRYLRVAHPPCSPHKRARIRAFYKNGVKELHFRFVIELLPTLLHISLFLFFAGLSVFLFNVNRTIFKAVTAWIALCVILYAFLTILPIIRKDSPYTAPLSTTVSFCLTGIRYLFFRLLQRFPQIDSFVRALPRDPTAVHLHDFFSHSMSKTAQEFAIKLKPDIDHRSLAWTFESLDEDTDLEKFFEGLPRLYDSETGRELNLKIFVEQNRNKLSSSLIGLMNRTLSSNLVTDFVKQRRMIICTKVVSSTSLLGPWWILRCVLLFEWSKFLECIEFGLLMHNWRSITDNTTSFAAQCVAALTISITQRDDRWFRLASDLLNVSKFVLQKYISNGDSVLLASIIFIARRTVQTYSGSADRHRNDILKMSSRTLETLCKLNVQSTLPELQHEFCDLWNQLVFAAQTEQRPQHVAVCTMTLKNIRKLYIALHDGSGAPLAPFYTAADDLDILDYPMSYPTCTIDDHRSLLPVQDLQFDEPPPDVAGTPSVMHMPPIIVPMPTPGNTGIMPIPIPATLPAAAYPPNIGAPLV